MNGGIISVITDENSDYIIGIAHSPDSDMISLSCTNKADFPQGELYSGDIVKIPRSSLGTLAGVLLRIEKSVL